MMLSSTRRHQALAGAPVEHGWAGTPEEGKFQLECGSRASASDRSTRSRVPQLPQTAARGSARAKKGLSTARSCVPCPWKYVTSKLRTVLHATLELSSESGALQLLPQVGLGRRADRH
eukprot:7015382-Pyramimonas_sp.AAC.1